MIVAFDDRSITNEDGERLIPCRGGCGTYVDELNIWPFCERCNASGSCDEEPPEVLRCWCGLEMRSTFGFGVYGHVGKRRPGDTHPASTRRPPRKHKKEGKR